MTTHHHFLAAILCDLGSPTPVLVYADWLEEEGEACAGWWRALGEGVRTERIAFNWHPNEVEIACAGNPRPDFQLTAGEIDDVVDNFLQNSTLGHGFVPVVLGHDDDAPCLGKVQWLWRSGDRLVAVLEGMYIERGFRQDCYWSVELWDRPPEGFTGRGRMLRRVSSMYRYQSIQDSRPRAAHLPLSRLAQGLRERLESHPDT